MTPRTFHRGAVVSQREPLKPGPENHFGLLVGTARTKIQREHQEREWLNAMCPLAIEQYGRSSYRNRQLKKGPIHRFGRTK